MLLILALTALLSLSACTEQTPGEGGADNGGGNEQATDFEYSISLKDAFGSPVSNMIVKILKGDESVGMKLVDDKSGGTVTGKLDNGTYSVEVLSPANRIFYYDDTVTLSNENKSITITIYDKASSQAKQELSFGFDAPYTSYEAPLLSNGAYRVELSDGIAYFVFVPTVRGRYSISVYDAEGAALGYHGGVFYVQESDLCSDDEEQDVYKNEDGVFVNIRNHHLGEDIQSASKFVFSVSAEGAEGCRVEIKRVGELEYNLDELPWDEVTLPEVPQKITLENTEDLTLKDFDIKDPAMRAVFNEDDGFYHLGDKDGPVIYLRLNTKSKYVEATLAEIADNNRIGAYIYDENGKFVAKRSYHSAILQYIAAADDTYGIYPMTEYMKEAIVNFGGANDWWSFGPDNRFFGSESIDFVKENAWLFAACYFEAPDASAPVLTAMMPPALPSTLSDDEFYA